MKKLIAVLIATIALCMNVQAADDDNINPLNVARAFALKTPTYFQCSLSGQMLVSNSWQNINMQFVVRKSDFAITNLAVNGSAIPLPEPIYGLPLSKQGVMRSVYVGVSAYTKDRQFAGHGYVDIPQITTGSHIEVILRPADVQIEIPLENALSYEGDINLNIEDFNYGYGYGINYNGKLYVSLPPVGGRYHYTITRRSDGSPLGEGWLEPFKAVETPDNTYFGVRYIGNVAEAIFNNHGYEDWIGFQIKSDCSIPTMAGTNVAGKVLFADVGTGGLEVVIGMGATIYVHQVTDDGEMPLLELKDESVSSGDWVQTRVYTTSYNVGKVVITIIPSSSRTESWINLHRFYNTPSSGGGGGGLGKATISEI